MARPPADVDLVAGLETLRLAVLLEDGELSACNAHPISNRGAHVHRLQHFAREVVDLLIGTLGRRSALLNRPLPA
jgi:hypothetical protein